MLTLKIWVKVTEYNMRNHAIPWQISMSIKVATLFYAISHRFRYINVSNS